MTRTLVAIYDNYHRANSAVRELIDNGFPKDNISIVVNNGRSDEAEGGGEEARPETVRLETVRPETARPGAGTMPKAGLDDDPAAGETGAGAGVGAGIGAAIGGIGGLLVGLGALVIPGIGPVLAAGPLAVALSTLTGAGVGAVAGGVTGGLLGALIGLGVPEQEAEFYTEGVRRGGVLVTVQTEDYNTEQITNILNRYQPININEKVSEWRAEGWTGSDPAASTLVVHPQGIADTLSVNVPVTGVVPLTGAMPASVSTNLQDSSAVVRQPDSAVVTQRDSAVVTQRDSAVVRQPDSAVITQLDSAAVTQVSSSAADHNADFDLNNSIYRNHYILFLAKDGNPYDYYVPAYRYGYTLAADPHYQRRPWDQIEPEIRKDWEMEHPGTWLRFKAAIQHAWEDVTGRNGGPQAGIH